MLKNYFKIDENTTVNSFLKDLSEKKNSQYIILDTNPEYFVDLRTIALRVQNMEEKLKNLKKPLSFVTGNQEDYFMHLINSGDRVVKADKEFYDFVDALNFVLNQDFDFLEKQINELDFKEVFALNEDDKLSTARNLFLKNKINLLPVIKDKKIIGEVRPIDFLINNLYSKDVDKASFYDEKKDGSLWNLPVENIVNYKPHTIEHTLTIRDALSKMVEKKLPSVIISMGSEIFSILTYKDIFRMASKMQERNRYNIEFVGVSELYDDEVDLVEEMAEKAMNKITRISNYDNLKITMKTLGNTTGTHKKKYEVKLMLFSGNKVLNVEKEISRGTNDEEHNNRVNVNWNTPQMVQEALSILEKKVKDEKEKGK